MKIIYNNKHAYYEYFIEETFEAGIELLGSEVKSIRGDKVTLKDSFVLIRNGEAYLHNANIVPYDKASLFGHEAKRDRRLLLHKAEIRKLAEKVQAKGYTVVPTKIYFKDSLVKVEIGLAKGKQLHDKRAAIAEKDIKRETERAVRDFKKGSF